MTYATVLLHLDAYPHMGERTNYAVRLARRFESHLVGMAAADHSLFGLSVSTGFAGTDSLAGALEASRVAALGRARAFQQRVETLQLKSFETVVDDEEDIEALIMRSGCSDLLIVGQTDPAWPHAKRARAQLEEIVLHSVAPTLIVPYAGEFPEVGNHMMIAWDGSPEVARAVVGAMPLLQRASRVHLVRCDTPVDIERSESSSVLDLPRDWLGRHGVRVDAWLEETGIDVADALLSRVADLGVDMLVMGAWGHPRWTERVMGGVTRKILSTMTVPVLMSH
jgi:nucleotide-binding universal stress UspA family protein